ncbi:kelch-like ECH-associated protein 1 [Paramacrobiotus metropolitanus]|uniref:kelch-like ECH-associated protein 1 n=1 Tax=Paramacrobiotus metropolitanus TaxID=2943436 RepID=UPI002445A81A|nr:kelch-like ECH-associated protein 1 [Paramacrobiotus metropolitanus]
MASPAFPFNRNQTLNLLYKLPTEQFVLGNITKGETCYTTDINVDGGPNYPQIPSSVWTVNLCIGYNPVDTLWTASHVWPKEPSDKLTSDCALTVECRVRPDAEGSCDNTVQIDPTGWKSIRSDDLTKIVRFGDTHCSLAKDCFVYVQLTFRIDQQSKNSIGRADLQRLLESQTLSDCTLVCAGQQFAVHRALLAGQSPVFAAMFQSDMQEKSTGICKINDISPDALKTVIQFVYTRADVTAGGSLMELWMAADKYDMADLRAECLRAMLVAASEATVEQALSYFDFAREHNLTKLRTAAVRVVSMDTGTS